MKGTNGALFSFIFWHPDVHGKASYYCLYVLEKLAGNHLHEPQEFFTRIYSQIMLRREF